MIAVSQYRALENKLRAYEKFLFSVEAFFELFDIKAIDDPLLKPRQDKQLVVAVTSDSGLMGGLNMQVIAQAVGELEKIPGLLIVIGERGKMYAQEYNVSFTSFSGIKDEERYAQAMQLRDYMLSKFFEESLGYIKIIYPKPISFTVQRVDSISCVPFSPTMKTTSQHKAIGDIILESDLHDSIRYLVYLWLGQKLYEVFGLSRLAEFAARFVHLEESAQRLKDLDKKLRLEYFRVRHELIDRNMRELFSARLLYAGK